MTTKKSWTQRSKVKVRRYLLRLFRKGDAPLYLALGFALGACTNFFPTFGLGLPLAIGLAYITRTSIFGSFVGETLFKIVYFVTLPLSFVVGTMIIPVPIRLNDLHSILALAKDWRQFLPYAQVFLVGGLVNTLVLGSILTLVNVRLLTSHREQIIAFLSREEENG
ncbi:MAG: DUF2062 domain-containing protein [Solirubrobacterales bacterium]